MAGDAKQFREFIDSCLGRSERASLVDVVAYFDHQNHTLPSTWRLNKALADLATSVELSLDGLHLERSSQESSVQLSDTDMTRIIEAYTKGLRSRSVGA